MKQNNDFITTADEDSSLVILNKMSPRLKPSSWTTNDFMN